MNVHLSMLRCHSRTAPKGFSAISLLNRAHSYSRRNPASKRIRVDLHEALSIRIHDINAPVLKYVHELAVICWKSKFSSTIDRISSTYWYPLDSTDKRNNHSHLLNPIIFQINTANSSRFNRQHNGLRTRGCPCEGDDLRKHHAQEDGDHTRGLLSHAEKGQGSAAGGSERVLPALGQQGGKERDRGRQSSESQSRWQVSPSTTRRH